MSEEKKDKKRPSPLATAWTKAKEKWDAKQARDALLKAAVAAATTVAVGVAAVAIDTARELQDRVDTLEARPVLDIAPLTKQSKDLSARVTALSTQAAQLAEAVRTQPTPTVTTTVHPRPQPTTSAAVTRLARDLSGLASSLADLGGRVEREAAAAGLSSAADAKALTALSTRIATSAKDLADQLGGQVTLNTQQAKDLVKLATDLSSTSGKITALAAKTDASIATIKAGLARIDTVAASAAASALAAATAAEQAKTAADLAASFTPYSVTSPGPDEIAPDATLRLAEATFTVPTDSSYVLTGQTSLPASRACKVLTLIVDGVPQETTDLTRLTVNHRGVTDVETAVAFIHLNAGQHSITLEASATAQVGCTLRDSGLTIQRLR